MEMAEIIAIMSSRRVFAANPTLAPGSDMGAGRNVVTVKGLLELIVEAARQGLGLYAFSNQ